MSAVERLCEALEQREHEVKLTARGEYVTRCPAHEDHTPSLSFREGDDTDIVITCYAGCDTAKVLAELGLTLADLRDGATPAASSRGVTPAPRAPAAEYVYTDEHSNPIFKMVRNRPGKTPRFQAVHRAGEHWKSGGCPEQRTTPYNLPEVLAAIVQGREVLVVEGERDVETARSLGVVATCNANGAGKWKHEHAEWLRDARVTIVRDDDEPGHKHAAEVAKSLQGMAASVRVVDVAASVRAAVDKGADLSDHVFNGYGLADLTPAEGDLISRYPPLDWHDVWDSTSDQPEWRVPEVIEVGRSHALFSPAKAGKSLLVAEVAAGLATGKTLLGRPNPNHGPVTVLYVDMENARPDLRQRLAAMGYGPADLGRLVYLSFPDLPPLDTARGGEHLLALAEHYRPGLIVLDTVSRVVTGEENSADTFRALYRLTLSRLKRAGHTVLRLDHEGKDPTAGQRGSSAKVDDVDTVWRLSVRGAATDDGSRALDLRCERQRSGHHPELIMLVRKANPLQHVRVDGADDRPEVMRIIAELDRLQVAKAAGRDICRKALSEAGVKISNNVLAEAITVRRGRPESPENLSGTGPAADDRPKIDNGCPRDAHEDAVTAGEACPGQVADRSDSSTAVPGGGPVRLAVPPGRGQPDGRLDRPGRNCLFCDLCGASPAVHFENERAVRCATHNPMTYTEERPA